MELYNEDCFEAFKKVKDRSVNLFLLDLPYGQTACKWDSVIDLDKMWKEIKRTLVKGGIVVMFCTTKFGFTLIQSNPKWFKYDLVWKKSKKVGFLSANKMPLRQHEMMYIFKETQGTYNPQKTEGKPYKKGASTKPADCYIDRETTRAPVENKGDRHPSSIIEKEIEYKGEVKDSYYGHTFKRQVSDPHAPKHPTSVVDELATGIENTVLDFKSVTKTVHKTQKPVELCEWLIKSYSNEGDMVMDFCMGSGTAGVACKNTNRNFIGVEMDEEIFKIAKNRIE